MISSICVALLFLILTAWADRNPFGAILTAFIVYLTLNVVGIIDNPALLFRGILPKIFCIAAFVGGIRSARQVAVQRAALEKLKAPGLETTEPLPEPMLACPKCQGVIQETDTFCGHCGNLLAATPDHVRREDVFDVLTPTLAYYFITLVLLCIYKLTSVFPEGFEGIVVITVIDVAIVIAFWGNYFQTLRPLFSLRGLSLKVMALTIVGAMVGSVVVSVVAEWINLSIQDDVFYSTYLFEDTKYPFLLSTLFIAVQPAIFEEVAFRGFLFDNLSKVTPTRSTVYVTAFVFCHHPPEHHQPALAHPTGTSVGFPKGQIQYPLVRHGRTLHLQFLDHDLRVPRLVLNLSPCSPHPQPSPVGVPPTGITASAS